MRLLPVGNDHGGKRVACRKSCSNRRRACEVDHQHLPLRNLSAHPRRRAFACTGESVRERAMPSRRMVILGGLGTAGALVVGYAMWPSHRLESADALAAGPGEKFVANWIKIGTDNHITVVVPHCDMGTGIFTSLPQMAAEELYADWDMVRVEQAPTDPLFANGSMIEGFAMNGKQPPAFLKGIVDNTFRFMAANLSLPGAGYVPQITGGPPR